MSERRHGWTQGQVNMFAKRFAQGPEGRAWTFFCDDVRSALLTQFVVNTIGANERDVTITEMLALRDDVALRLTTTHGRRVE